MRNLFNIARVAAVAAFALGAGALLTPAPAEAQGRQGYSAGGGARFSGGRVSAPRMGVAPRMGYSQRGVAPRVSGYRPVVRSGVRPVVRHGVRPGVWRPGRSYSRGGRYPYWPAAAGVGLGLVGAAAVANSGYYYANGGYGAQQCWLERRTIRTNYGRRMINVRVCPVY
ncbi:MAG: hypothetical protein Q8M31_19205 [Beijerinckiaceae bacterium]|nr:hypothetical protein [Beijerinckiaceae bacterium]